MSVAPMSRWTKRAYLRQCHEKRRKKEFGRIKVNMISLIIPISLPLSFFISMLTLYCMIYFFRRFFEI